jgi:ABC-type branched-subunit amino acid transport system substrate-binding protein
VTEIHSQLNIGFVFLLFLSCAEVSKPVNPVIAKTKPERTIELPPEQPEPIVKRKKLKLQPELPRETSHLKAKCLVVHERIVGTLQDLRSKAKIDEDINPEILQLTSIAKEQCHEDKSAKLAIAEMSQFLHASSTKIGLILPITGRRSVQAASIRSGIDAACLENGVKFEDAFVLKDSGGTNQGAINALGDLILRENIAMLITGFDDVEVAVTMPISKQLMLPVLILNSKSEMIKSNRFAFQVYPLQSQLSKSIVEILKAKAISRVAIFRPASGKANLLIDDLRKNFDSEGITLTDNLGYVEGDFDSMELAVKKVAGIDYVARQSEYDQAFKRAKKAAQENDSQFDPRTIILPSLVQTEAVIIPDNFRIVKHFVNLFKYHGVDRIQLIGNHEWRSQELLKPWDSFLQGAVFVDFIGTYDKLPRGIRMQFGDSPFFVQPELAGQLDFRLIGYHSAQIVLRIPLKLGLRKKDLVADLFRLKGNDGFYSPQNIFSQNRASEWPTYHFMVSDQGLMQQNFVPPVQKAPSTPQKIH